MIPTIETHGYQWDRGDEEMRIRFRIIMKCLSAGWSWGKILWLLGGSLPSNTEDIAHQISIVPEGLIKKAG